MSDEQSSSPWQNSDSKPPPPSQLIINMPSKEVSIGIFIFGTLVIFVAFGLFFASTLSTEAIASTLDSDSDGVLIPARCERMARFRL